MRAAQEQASPVCELVGVDEGFGYNDEDEGDAERDGTDSDDDDLVPRVGRRDARESSRRNRFDRIPTRESAEPEVSHRDTDTTRWCS
jgi:hypothetical protein